MGNLKPLVNNPQLYSALQEYIEDMIKQEQKNFENVFEDELPLVRERIRTLRRFQKLKEVVNAAE